jgi:hypothetical protein
VIGVIMNLWDNKGKEIKKGFKDFTKRAWDIIKGSDIWIFMRLFQHSSSGDGRYLGRIQIPVLEQHMNLDLGSAVSYAQEQTSVDTWSIQNGDLHWRKFPLEVRSTCMLNGQKWLEGWRKWPLKPNRGGYGSLTLLDPHQNHT